MYKINLGCGKDILPDWINYDVFPLSEEVIKLDMEKDKIPLPDNSVDEVRAKDVLEHLNNFIPIMNEMWRVLIPGGRAFIRVPLWPSNSVWKDPTHKRGFVYETLEYFCKYALEGKYWKNVDSSYYWLGIAHIRCDEYEKAVSCFCRVHRRKGKRYNVSSAFNRKLKFATNCCKRKKVLHCNESFKFSAPSVNRGNKKT